MITVKHSSALYLLLILILLFSSCSPVSFGNPPITYELGTEATDEFRAPLADHYFVILPNDSSELLSARAEQFAADLQEQTETPVSVLFDNEPLYPCQKPCLILLGNTSYILSQKYLSDCKQDDYICTWDSGALILGGRSEAATLAALTRFCDELLPYANAEILINNDQYFSYFAEYEHEPPMVNGYRLDRYTLVYPDLPQMSEKQIVLALRDAIADQYGTYLDVICEGERTDSLPLIAVGACFSSDTPTSDAQILVSGSAISLCGCSEYELACAAEAFFLSLKQAEAESTALTLPPVTTVACGVNTVSLLPLSLADSQGVSSIESIAPLLRNPTLPTIISFNRLSDATLSLLSLTMPNQRYVAAPLQSAAYLFYDQSAFSIQVEDKLTTDVGHAEKIRCTLTDTAFSFSLFLLCADTQEEVAALLDAITPLAQSETRPVVTLLYAPSLATPPSGFSLCDAYADADTSIYLSWDEKGAPLSLIPNEHGYTLHFLHPFLP